MKRTSFLIGICAALILVCVFVAAMAAGHVFSAKPTADISKEQARQIALQDAGEASANVTFTRNTLETENDRLIYRVEFYTDSTSYQYKIDGSTGSVSHRNAQTTHRAKAVNSKEFQSQKPSDGLTPESESQSVSEKEEDALKYIGVGQAQKIALKDAGFKKEQVVFEKARLDHEDSIIIYDVHFLSQGFEYEYKIGALDGAILEKEIEMEMEDD